MRFCGGGRRTTARAGGRAAPASRGVQQRPALGASGGVGVGVEAVVREHPGHAPSCLASPRPARRRGGAQPWRPAGPLRPAAFEALRGRGARAGEVGKGVCARVPAAW